jgi:hypothetical protein
MTVVHLAIFSFIFARLPVCPNEAKGHNHNRLCLDFRCQPRWNHRLSLGRGEPFTPRPQRLAVHFGELFLSFLCFLVRNLFL